MDMPLPLSNRCHEPSISYFGTWGEDEREQLEKAIRRYETRLREGYVRVPSSIKRRWLCSCQRAGENTLYIAAVNSATESFVAEGIDMLVEELEATSFETQVLSILDAKDGWKDKTSGPS